MDEKQMRSSVGILEISGVVHARVGLTVGLMLFMRDSTDLRG